VPKGADSADPATGNADQVVVGKATNANISAVSCDPMT
jgi:hypothetical protein